MPILDQVITDQYALYCSDCMAILPTLPDGSIHFSIYSLPFQSLYTYSSDHRDLSNSLNREEFFEQYQFIVKELHRVTMPGRLSSVHCTDIPSGNSGLDHLYDFPGDIIRLHEKTGWFLTARHCIFKEPLTVRNRTMTKSLSHRSVVEDSTRCSIANADQLLVFRRSGTNPIPVTHPEGLTYYAGSQQMPTDILQYRNWTGKQTENKFSHWIWRQYASSFWIDVRIDRVLPYREAKSDDDERHIHPTQMDCIERGIIMYSNPGETILSPFGGVGTEPYCAVALGRKGVAIELKASYYRQMVKNVQLAAQHTVSEQQDLFSAAKAQEESSVMDDLEVPF